MKIKLGFTGTRYGMNSSQREEIMTFLDFVFRVFDSIELHHGDCIGADHDMHQLFTEMATCHGKSVNIYIHTPDNKTQRAFCSETTVLTDLVTINELAELPYLKRNKNIVNVCDFLIACPSSHTEQLRSGTWATIRYARKTGKKHEIYI